MVLEELLKVLIPHLLLRNNQLTELPADMKNLGKLRSITLNHNRCVSVSSPLCPQAEDVVSCCSVQDEATPS